MRGIHLGMAVRHAWLIFVVAIVSACGGGGGGAGGGGSSGSPAAATFSAAFSPASINTSTIAGYAQPVSYSATLTYTGMSSLYLVAEGDAKILASITGNVAGNSLSGVITFRGDLAVGNYSTTFYVHACLDTQCKSEVSGSPVSLPITFAVLPNIQVQQQQVSLQRTGTDPAPTALVQVTVPPAAGTVTMTATGPADAFSASFDGAAIHIATSQVRAGQYSLQLALQGSSDPRYTQTVTVTYTVYPPPGGEQVLSVSPNSVNVVVPQGMSLTQQLVVTPPTWTSNWDPPQVLDTRGMLSLANLGNNVYQLTFNAASAQIGSYSADVTFSAGPTGGTATAHVNWSVAASFYTTGNFVVTLDATSTSASLQMSAPVVTVDGVPATWSASTSALWMQVSPTSGTTGTNPLVVTIDPTLGGTDNWTYAGNVNLSINRTGTSPEAVPVGVYNNLPELQRSIAVLSGTGGRIYIDGAIPGLSSALLSTNSLSVTGATLAAASYRDDTRFIGTVSLLALDVTGAVPGIPIVISANTPLASSQVSVAVKAPVQVTPAFAALAFGAYRPAVYAPGLDAFYFSSPDTVYRWAQASGSWSLGQFALGGGVTGVALRQDEQQLYAAIGPNLVRLDPITLALTAEGGPLFDASGGADVQFDGTAPATMATLAYASDGRAIASVANPLNLQLINGSAYWISGHSTTRKLPDLTAGPQVADPGTTYVGNGQSGVGLAASPSRHVITATDPGGNVALYQASLARWSPGSRQPSGTAIVAVSDNGQRMVRSDGIVLDSGSEIGNLIGVVPFTHQVGGYGLSQDGHYGLVYGYQVNPVNGAQPASDGTVWVVDLSQLPATPLTSSAIVATIALSSPVGCTSSTLATGETCQHNASITVAPGSGSAFVLGPRGVAAVALPASVEVMTAEARRPMAAGQMRQVLDQSPVTRPLGVLPSGH
jgi:hypothetical protein